MGPALHDEEITLPGVLTVADAAAWLGVSTKWIFRRVKEGRLYVVGRNGRCLLVGVVPTTDLPVTVSALPSPCTTPRAAELCRIVHCGPGSAVVTIRGARAARVLDSVIVLDRQVSDGEGWRVSTAVLPLLHAAMRLRGIDVEVIPDVSTA